MITDLRDERGRFLPGNKPEPGPGRPRKESAEKLRAAIEEVIGNGTLPKWRAAMKERLERGDQWATEFVFERIAGKVPTSLELGGPDGGPIQHEDVTGLTDDERAERVAGILDAARARRTGQADRGAAGGDV